MLHFNYIFCYITSIFHILFQQFNIGDVFRKDTYMSKLTKGISLSYFVFTGIWNI